MSLGLPSPQRDHSEAGSAVDGGFDASAHRGVNGHGAEGNGSARTGNGRFAPSDVYDTDSVVESSGFAINDHIEPPKERPKGLDRMAELEERVERLSGVCEAMWRLISEEIGLGLDRLTAKVAEFEANGVPSLDGTADESGTCPNCGNKKPSDERLCLFCSARAPIDGHRH